MSSTPPTLSASSNPQPPTSSSSEKKPMKKANKPFLVHQKYLASLRARGDSPPPRSFFAQAIFWSLLALVTSALVSQMVTESWTWGNDERYFGGLRTLNEKFKEEVLGVKKAMRDFSEAELKTYDGKDEKLPLYLAIDGDVYDVSANRKTYGPGGSYDFFAGVDAARSYVTGCFKTHLTHDLRGFSQKDYDALNHWKSFFEKSEKYHKVGRVVHAPIDPESAIPERFSKHSCICCNQCANQADPAWQWSEKQNDKKSSSVRI